MKETRPQWAANYDEVAESFAYFTGLLTTPIAEAMVRLAKLSPADQIREGSSLVLQDPDQFWDLGSADARRNVGVSFWCPAGQRLSTSPVLLPIAGFVSSRRDAQLLRLELIPAGRLVSRAAGRPVLVAGQRMSDLSGMA